ncbi:MAG: cation diffusion facilitator family transporter [Thermoguttaceae bacterium]
MQTKQSEELTNNEAVSAIRRVTWLGCYGNLVLVALKFLAGFFGHSQVLIADAIHSLSDLLTDAAVLFGTKYWGEPADEGHPHGHAKVESLVTLFIGAALFLVGIGLVWDAVISILKYISGDVPPPPTWLPLVAAIISVIVKEYLYQITVKVGMRTRSSAVVANAWHHRSDALSSIPAVIAVAACLFLGDKYTFLDPVGTVVVACMIIYASWAIMAPTFSALLDAGIARDREMTMIQFVLAIPEVKGVHRFRSRRVGPNGLAVDLHVQVNPQMAVTDAHQLSHLIQRSLKGEDEDIVDVFVHIEPDDDEQLTAL